jgi:hypothetical protein
MVGRLQKRSLPLGLNSHFGDKRILFHYLLLTYEQILLQDPVLSRRFQSEVQYGLKNRLAV